MKVITNGDLVLGETVGDVIGVDIPNNLINLPFSCLRLVNGVIQDVSSNTSWFIDQSGQKHIVQSDLSWQSLTCDWDDELLFDNTWCVITADVLDERYIFSGESQIDAIADSIYTTSASRAARYERKLDQATAYKTAGYPMPIDADLYPYIASEAIERNITEQAMADLILFKSQAFEAFGAKMETLRVKLKTDVQAASDKISRQTAIDAIIAVAETEKTNLMSS